jgi:hypothetical protein
MPTLRRVLPLLALLFCTSALRAADNAAEIQLQRSLDATIDLSFEKIELSKAFEMIADKAKISMTIDQAAYDCLPYGATTIVSATFNSSTARAAIEEILTPLGLEQAVSGASVVIRPSAPLARIGRRAEWDELKLLQSLRKTTMSKVDQDWTANLRTLLGKPDLNVRITDTSQQDKALAAVKALLPCTVVQALDCYAAQSNQLWTIRGKDIVILPTKQWIEGQLERPIVVDFTNAPLASVIAELGHLSRIDLQPAPGLYQAVPTVSLKSSNGTVKQTLEALSGATGIPVEVTDNRIILDLPIKPGTPQPAPRSDAIIGRIGLPLKDGTIMDLYLHESDLPPDLQAARQKKIQEALQALQKAAAESATQPK